MVLRRAVLSNGGRLSDNAEIIGTHDHESHFVFDLIYNSKTQIKPDVHSTDSHGVNSLNFALLHFFGYQFAPRYKNLRKRTRRLVGFKKVSEYPEDDWIKPSRKAKSNNIIKNWDSISRIIFSLGARKTRQSTIVRKLSALPDNHSLKSALHEYNTILESIHILKYINDFGFRKNIQTALNRGEAYHQLQRDLSFANRGRPRSRKTHEQVVWSECKRLLANCIVYYNTSVLSEILDQHTHHTGIRDQLEGISPVSWSHINLYGYYRFKALNDKHLDISIITQPIFDFWQSFKGDSEK